jgi:2-desacetyl-2-hydroxyethyl bacteriochlorophyllide A dehydrogenase
MGANRMRAVVVSTPGLASVETLKDPVLLEQEVIVQVLGCGICGTDLHIFDEGLPGLRYPVIPGHEPWGEIVEVNKAETTLHLGDLVAIDPSLHCGLCQRCQRGRGNLCERWGAIGGTRSGAWAEFVAVPRHNIHSLEKGFPLDCAPIIEPVACALRGIKQLKPHLDTPALIIGGGTMGMLLALLLDLQGVGPITVVEVNDDRAQLARQLLPTPILGPDDLADLQADLVIDATGSSTAIEMGLKHVAPGGTMLIFGVASPTAKVSLSPFDIYEREITVVGSKAILHTFSLAIETVRRHASLFRPLITNPGYPLERFHEALAALQSGSAVKVVIEPSSPL